MASVSSMKSALFIDFDNVYSGLKQLDPQYADRFARYPAQWMNWLTESLGLPDHSPKDSKRRMLVRRCYLNPQAYQRFRPSFNLAGFEIEDCPALTSEGKTSTDIHMVLDIVDLLQHEAHYDEFIVFSADADFTPVLRRLRRWDRRTTVLAIGFPSAAYRASADLLIDQDDFVRHALGFADEPEPTTVATAEVSQAEVTLQVLNVIRQSVSESQEPVPLARLAQLALSKVEGLDASSWAGHGGFRQLLESGGLGPLEVCLEGGGVVRDPKRHAKPTVAAKQSNRQKPADIYISSQAIESLPPDGWEDLQEFYPLAKQIHEVTGIPLLPPAKFQALFRIIASDVAAHPFHLMATVKRVRDRCKEEGYPIGRADVNHVLRGLLLRGHSFEDGPNDALLLGQKLADNVRSLCLREQMMLDKKASDSITEWISAAR